MTIKQQGGVFGRNPTFNDVTIDGTFSSSGDMSIAGNLSVGTNSASSDLHVKGNTVAVGAYQIIAEGVTGGYGAGVSFQSQLTGGSLAEMAKITADGEQAWNTTASTQDAGLNFYTCLDGSVSKKMTLDSNGTLLMNGGNVKFASGDGIDFSATSGTGTSELFDDYEEGTWTPVDAGGNVTYTSNAGSYTKVGNLVTAFATLLVPTNSNANALVVGGLPFAVSTSGLEGQVTRFGGATAFTNANVNTTLIPKTDETILVYLQDGTQVVNSQFSNKTLKLYVVYQAA